MLEQRAPRRFGGLWRDSDFLKLWGGQTVSIFGSLVTRVILPIVAVLNLRATLPQVALLYICDAAPALILGLVAGALADRMRRRPLLIAADTGRALALLAVPLMAALGNLSLALLYTVIAVTSALTTVFDTAYPAYLATLVSEDRLLEGNAKLTASMSVSEVAGFGAAGALAQLLTAPMSVLVDAATYIVSIVSLALIRAREPHPRPTARRPRVVELVGEVIEGLRLTWAHPARRAITGALAIRAMCGSLLETALVIFVLRDLRLGPTLMGISFGVGGVAAFLGALAAPRLVARLGHIRTMRWAIWLTHALNLLMPIAGGPMWLAFTLLTAPQLGDAALTVYEISARTTLQLATPSGALGRVVASGAFLASAGQLVGLTLGATVGAALGARGTLGLAIGGMLLAPLLLSLTPLRGSPKETRTGGVRSLAG
ncbi:MAG TPA: MFS transporter [Ktedonobacterales bacterium]